MSKRRRRLGEDRRPRDIKYEAEARGVDYRASMPAENQALYDALLRVLFEAEEAADKINRDQPRIVWRARGGKVPSQAAIVVLARAYAEVHEALIRLERTPHLRFPASLLPRRGDAAAWRGAPVLEPFCGVAA